MGMERSREGQGEGEKDKRREGEGEGWRKREREKGANQKGEIRGREKGGLEAAAERASVPH